MDEDYGYEDEDYEEAAPKKGKGKKKDKPKDPAEQKQKKEVKREPKKKPEKKAEKKSEKKAEKKQETGTGEDSKDKPKTSGGKEEAEAPTIIPAQCVPVDESRAPISIVFIGHVDVGKSTICGNVMVITEKVDTRTIQKYEQEAKAQKRDTWWLAYVMDINDDERARGKTVEVGRATFTTATKRYTIYDAPGHQNYVPNMIMGAAMADIGGLVISAKKGEFESGFERGGQTIEHMLLARSLGIQKLIIIINKMDEPSVRWSKERYEQIKADLTPLLVRYGFNLEKNVVWVPLSGLTGANIAVKVDAKLCPWYEGPTLMEILDTIDIAARDVTGTIRIPVLDKLKDQGMDIFGKVHSGKIDLGAQVMVMPYKMPITIVSIQNTDDQYVAYAKAGENIKFRVKGLPTEDFIYKGCILCSPDNLCPVFQTFIAEVKIVLLLKHKPIVSVGYQCILHLHTLAEECIIDKLLGVKGPKDPDYKDAKFGREEDMIRCLISTTHPIAAEKYSVMRQLGRFTLRDEGKTIAIGTVQKYQPLKEAISQ